MKRKRRGGLSARQIYVDRLLGGAALLALHEASSIQGHVEAGVERLRVAHKARSVSQLVGEQLDLVPESRNRWRRDHEVRRALWRGLLSDLAPANRSH
jgi:hypothetical protein